MFHGVTAAPFALRQIQDGVQFPLILGKQLLQLGHASLGGLPFEPLFAVQLPRLISFVADSGALLTRHRGAPWRGIYGRPRPLPAAWNSRDGGHESCT